MSIAPKVNRIESIMYSNFQKNTSVMQTLNKFNQSNQVIELKDFHFLEGSIKGIFTNK